MYPQKLRLDRRGARRWSVRLPATLTIEGHEFPCTILNLSDTAARIEARGVQFGPSLATLKSDRFGCIEARVRWARGTEAGLCFETNPDAVGERLKPILPGMSRREKAVVIQQRLGAGRSIGRHIRARSPSAA